MRERERSVRKSESGVWVCVNGYAGYGIVRGE